MDALDKKLNDVFTGYVVRKDLVKLVKGNAAVPSYVLEYLLGQNCATDDEGQIEAGVERVRSILAKHYVQRAEAGAIRSDIKQIGQKRIIDKVSVTLNEKRDAYEASFENLGVSKVLVSSDTVKKNRRLLVSGVWCIADLSYEANEARDESPMCSIRLSLFRCHVSTLRASLHAVRNFLRTSGLTYSSARLAWILINWVAVPNCSS